MDHLITVSPDGSVSGLQMKRGKGVDLRTLGIARIERVTLIEWEPQYQKWFIRTVESDRSWTISTIRESFPFHPSSDSICWRWWDRWLGVELVWPDKGFIRIHGLPINKRDSVLYFDDYEDAVAVEVAVIQARVLAGSGVPA